MRTGLYTTLDPTLHSNNAQTFEAALLRKIVGQDSAIRSVVEIYQMFLAGLNPPHRPLGNLLFLGPTGSGKTRVVEAMAEALFGDPQGDNRGVDFSNCVIFMTSNLGAAEMSDLLNGGMGFAQKIGSDRLPAGQQDREKRGGSS